MRWIVKVFQIVLASDLTASLLGLAPAACPSSELSISSDSAACAWHGKSLDVRAAARTAGTFCWQNCEPNVCCRQGVPVYQISPLPSWDLLQPPAPPPASPPPQALRPAHCKERV
eukprot:1164248-Rhodomonas_salina.1